MPMVTQQPEQILPLLDPEIYHTLRRALDDTEFDFEAAAVPNQVLNPNGGEPTLTLPGYFRLLEQISHAIGDETLNLSRRPLLPGALQFALSQAINDSTLEAAMRRIAKNFNLMHGGEYNHVFIQDQSLIYEVVIDEFPYPEDVTRTEQDGLMECILILMHFMFVTLIASDELDQRLTKVRTRRALSSGADPRSQLSFWQAPVIGSANGFSLHYDLDAGALPIKANEQSLPHPNALYGEVAEYVAKRAGATLASQSTLSQVSELLRIGVVSEREIAAKLNVSTRTLRRRLVRDGKSFRSLVDEAKNSQACELIRNAVPFAAIAEKLGYADERSFRRAFIRWNNLSLSQYRRKHDVTSSN